MPDEGSPAVRAVRGSFSPEAAVQALAKAKGTAATAPEQDFVGQLLEDYAPGDLPQLTLADFGALALDLWTWCAAHPPLDEPAIRLTDAHGGGRAPPGAGPAADRAGRPAVPGGQRDGRTGRSGPRRPRHDAPGGGGQSRAALGDRGADGSAGRGPARAGCSTTSRPCWPTSMRRWTISRPCWGWWGRTLAELERTAPDSPDKAEGPGPAALAGGPALRVPGARGL